MLLIFGMLLVCTRINDTLSRHDFDDELGWDFGNGYYIWYGTGYSGSFDLLEF